MLAYKLLDARNNNLSFIVNPIDQKLKKLQEKSKRLTSHSDSSIEVYYRVVFFMVLSWLIFCCVVWKKFKLNAEDKHNNVRPRRSSRRKSRESQTENLSLFSLDSEYREEEYDMACDQPNNARKSSVLNSKPKSQVRTRRSFRNSRRATKSSVTSIQRGSCRSQSLNIPHHNPWDSESRRLAASYSAPTKSASINYKRNSSLYTKSKKLKRNATQVCTTTSESKGKIYFTPTSKRQLTRHLSMTPVTRLKFEPDIKPIAVNIHDVNDINYHTYDTAGQELKQEHQRLRHKSVNSIKRQLEKNKSVAFVEEVELTSNYALPLDLQVATKNLDLKPSPYAPSLCFEDSVFIDSRTDNLIMQVTHMGDPQKPTKKTICDTANNNINNNQQSKKTKIRNTVETFNSMTSEIKLNIRKTVASLVVKWCHNVTKT